MVYEVQPTKEVVISKLQAVLKSEISREEFHLWSYKWVENFDRRSHLSQEEEKLYSYFIYLLAIDLEIEEGNYFHGDEEISEWIEKIEAGIVL